MVIGADHLPLEVPVDKIDDIGALSRLDPGHEFRIIEHPLVLVLYDLQPEAIFEIGQFLFGWRNEACFAGGNGLRRKIVFTGKKTVQLPQVGDAPGKGRGAWQREDILEVKTVDRGRIEHHQVARERQADAVRGTGIHIDFNKEKGIAGTCLLDRPEEQVAAPVTPHDGKLFQKDEQIVQHNALSRFPQAGFHPWEILFGIIGFCGFLLQSVVNVLRKLRCVEGGRRQLVRAKLSFNRRNFLLLQSVDHLFGGLAQSQVKGTNPFKEDLPQLLWGG